MINRPIGECGKIFPNSFVVRVEKVRTVFVNQNSVFVRFVVTISGNVPAAFDEQNFFVALSCKAFGKNRAGKSGSDNDNVKHKKTSVIQICEKFTVNDRKFQLPTQKIETRR